MDPRDEYIADSEDEDMLLDPAMLSTSLGAAVCVYTGHKPGYNHQGSTAYTHTNLCPHPSGSSTSVSDHSRPGPSTILPKNDAVLSATSVPSSSNGDPAGTSKPRPRPKPRPAYKAANPSNPASSSSSSGIPFPARVAAPLQPPRVEPASEFTSISEGFTGDIAERTKMRSRAKASGSKNTSRTDVIELTSDSEDELSLLPSSKAKDKGKGKQTNAADIPRKSPKRPQLVDESDIPPSTMNTLPVASDVHLSSQLPPSDPPLPSSSVPPTSNPGLANSPPSSPIPRPPPIRKRKRPGLLSSDDEDLSAVPDRESQKLMPPPPARPVPPTRVARRSLSPLLIEPLPTETEPKASEPKTKPKAARKKKAADEEEDWVGDAKPKPKGKGKGKKNVVVDEDDDEDDWAAKPKAKPKAARKSQKKKKAEETAAAGKGKGKQAEPKLVVEVVISPSKRRSPTKADEDGEGDKAEVAMDEGPIVHPDLDMDFEEAVEFSTTAAVAKGTKGKGKEKARKRAVMSSDEESDSPLTPPPPSTKKVANNKGKEKAVLSSPEQDGADPTRVDNFKENTVDGPPPVTPLRPPSSSSLSTPRPTGRSTSLIPKTSNTPMSELIRRVNSKPGSPFPSSSRPFSSPFLKSSKSMLKRIAPLHPNRRTPPPPPPRPPPPKKTKKQLEMEERWEVELEESVEGWFAMGDEERAALRRAKRDAVFGVDD
ncbi:hypothetical protein BC629DRAFT_1437523 [Irpex lacteus]|nr:hypothetical protein BC629DRAFT_1437523 [Irpex lacteus]